MNQYDFTPPNPNEQAIMLAICFLLTVFFVAVGIIAYVA